MKSTMKIEVDITPIHRTTLVASSVDRGGTSRFEFQVTDDRELVLYRVMVTDWEDHAPGKYVIRIRGERLDATSVPEEMCRETNGFFVDIIAPRRDRFVVSLERISEAPP